MTSLTKIDDRRQAVRSPETIIRGGGDMGEVALSEKPGSWDAFFDALKGLDVPEDFLNRDSQAETPRDPFEGWIE